ncbi:hypothetical protein ACI2KR_06855 [Pseudomonas luteola]
MNKHDLDIIKHHGAEARKCIAKGFDKRAAYHRKMQDMYFRLANA